MSGKALTFIIESEEIAPIQNAQELFQKLQQQFKHRSFATSFNDWENLKMLPQESVRNLAHRINLAFHRTFPEDDTHSATANRAKLYKLIKVLPAEVRLKIMQDNITEYSTAVEKAALIQDCLRNNKIFSNTENINPQMELLNYQFHNLKAKSENSKISEESNRFKQTNSHRNFQNRSPRGKFKKNNSNFHSYKQNYQSNRKFSKNIRHQNSNPEDKNEENLPSIKPICQLCERRGHLARQCRKYNIEENNKNLN